RVSRFLRSIGLSFFLGIILKFSVHLLNFLQYPRGNAMEEGIPVSSGNAITRCISRIKKLNLGMNFYKIIGRGNDCHWINLKSIIFVEFDDDLKEIIFDGMIRIMMDE